MHHLLLLTALLTPEGLTFAEALRQAERAPRVEGDQRAAHIRSELADGLSSMTHNPNVQLQPGVRAFDSGGTAPEVYLGVSQRFSLSHAGSRRREALQAEVSEGHAIAEVTRKQARKQSASAWIARWTAEREHQLITTHMAEVDAWLQGAEVAREAGELTLVDTGMLRLYRAEVALLAHAAEGAAVEAGLQLSLAIGRRDGSLSATVGELPAFHHAPGTEYALDALPEVQAAHAGQAAAERRLREHRAATGPTWSVGAYGWREGSGDMAALAMLDIDVPLFELGGRERASDSAELERARGATEQAELAATVERTMLLHDVEHTTQQAHLVDQQRAAAEALVQAQRLRWQAREGTTQELLNAQRAALDAALSSLRTQAAVALSRFLFGEQQPAGVGSP